MTDRQTALVLGANGGIGSEMVRQLAAHGWRVKALTRGSAKPVPSGQVEWVEGDVLDAGSVARAAAGCSVIVHAVNPPAYRNWGQLVLPMIDNTIAAARAQGATIVLPGTVYNFGPDAFPVLHEDSPQQPLTRKGKIRTEMEKRLRDATLDGAARVIVVRAGDFFGPGARNNWLSQGMVSPGTVPAQIKLPAAPGIGHQFAYLPDVAATMIALLGKRGKLPGFADFHMAGHWDEDGAGLGRAIQRVVQARGGSKPKLKAFPWWLVRLAAPFNETLREMVEMRYLWQQPVRMENRRLLQMLGEEPHTPLDEALERTLESLDCLPARPGATPAGYLNTIQG